MDLVYVTIQGDGVIMNLEEVKGFKELLKENGDEGLATFTPITHSEHETLVKLELAVYYRDCKR